MSAGQIQKPNQVKQNDTAEQKAPAVFTDVTVDETDVLDNETDVEATLPKVAPKKVVSEKLDKVQKRAKGIKLTPIDVTATDVGYYGNRRLKVGDKFKLDDVTDFSEKWMKKI